MAADLKQPTMIRLTALVVDPIDGMSRILADAQRFGLRATSGRFAEHVGGSLLTLDFTSSAPLDVENLHARFDRYPCILRLTTEDRAMALPRAA